MRGQKDTRPCAHCGQLLTRLISQARGINWYCGAKCQTAHAPSPITQPRSGRLTKTCACGRVFQTYPSVNQRFCSRSCSSTYEPKKPRLGTETPCETCGEPVYANQSQRAKGQGRFCSMGCHNKAQTKVSTVKVCVVCGNEMVLKPSQVARNHCSRRCMGAAKTVRPLNREHNGRPARTDGDGYVWVWEPDHTNAKRYKGWYPEHRLVAEQALGRVLTSDDQVDHINRVRDDNRPENLQVLDSLTHARKTAADQKGDRGELAEYRRRFGPLS